MNPRYNDFSGFYHDDIYGYHKPMPMPTYEEPDTSPAPRSPISLVKRIKRNKSRKMASRQRKRGR